MMGLSESVSAAENLIDDGVDCNLPSAEREQIEVLLFTHDPYAGYNTIAC